MYRIAEMTSRQRARIGWTLMVSGFVAVGVGTYGVHYSLVHLSGHPGGWIPKVAAYFVGFGGSQAMILGSLLLWVVGHKMTWARATFTAFVTWLELVLIFGIVPSEWLNLSQTDLNWSYQRIAFTIPSWLVLGNPVDVTWGAIKDAISGAYNTGLLVVAAIFAYKVQDIGKPRPAGKHEAPRSPYGRPLVKGES